MDLPGEKHSESGGGGRDGGKERDRRNPQVNGREGTLCFGTSGQSIPPLKIAVSSWGHELTTVGNDKFSYGIIHTYMEKRVKAEGTWPFSPARAREARALAIRKYKKMNE